MKGDGSRSGVCEDSPEIDWFGCFSQQGEGRVMTHNAVGGKELRFVVRIAVADDMACGARGDQPIVAWAISAAFAKNDLYSVFELDPGDIVGGEVGGCGFGALFRQ